MNYMEIVVSLIAMQTTYLSLSYGLKRTRSSKQYIFVDTSVLIDGRIVSVAESGFIPGILAIPRSVVGELQFLADNGDSEKRSRARHGLDIIKKLQELDTVTVEVFTDSVRAEEGVDNRLLSLAKKYSSPLCTIDYNLNKVAQVEGISVLNVNELAKTLRMAYLPGEKISLELTSKGNDSHQAVGHLPDGTMVVVEQASQYIGKVVEIEFIRSLQTSAGKMMFGKLTQAPKKPQQQKKQPLKGNKPVAAPKKAETPREKSRRTHQEGNVTTKTESDKRQPRRRRTPEDALVELANK